MESTETTNQSDRSPGVFRRLLNGLDRTWLQADPRALGLFRIVFGLLCTYDVLRRFEWIETFYSNTGVLSNHFTIYSPHASHNFSFLYMCSSPTEVKVFFAFALFCLFCFTIGWRTRLFHLLSMACIISIHTRNVLLENGGDVVMNLWWLWTLWLPLGARYSVDAIRRSLKTGPDVDFRGLSLLPEPSTKPVRSLAVFAVLFQLTVIYFFNTIHKGGQTWADGSALAWVFEQDRIATPLTLWARETWPLWISKFLSWGTLVIEGMAPLLLLTPIFTVWCRRIAFITLCGLHIGIWLLTDVGLFSPTMMVSYIILFSAADMDLFARFLKRFAGPPIRIWYDSDCGVCHLCARLGVRTDRLAQTTWYGHAPDAPRPADWTSEQLQERRQDTIIVFEPESGRLWTRHEAMARIVRAMPLGFLLSWVLVVPVLSSLAGAVYDGFSQRRHLISAWFGYGVCGVPSEPLEIPIVEPPTAARLFLGKAWVVFSTLAIGFFLIVAVSQNTVEARSIKKLVKHKQPAWAKATVQYGRFFQGWQMFAPDAPRRDGALVIDVELPDGTHIDPQTGLEPVFEAADRRRMAWDQFWGSYSMRIAAGRNRRFRKGFTTWLTNSKIRRLNLPAGQRIKSFTAWWIGDKSPDPAVGGEPKIYERNVVVKWPAASKK